jgi:hypothetical protein
MRITNKEVTNTGFSGVKEVEFESYDSENNNARLSVYIVRGATNNCVGPITKLYNFRLRLVSSESDWPRNDLLEITVYEDSDGEYNTLSKLIEQYKLSEKESVGTDHIGDSKEVKALITFAFKFALSHSTYDFMMDHIIYSAFNVGRKVGIEITQYKLRNLLGIRE